MSVNYVPSLGKKNVKVNTVWVLSVNNILGRNNVYDYQFPSNGQRQIEQRPAFKQFFMIGVFLSFGVDKTQEIIDRNL
ncbi:hypothetical protein [Riemerella columbina]|uniref:hypothetical protein n=1 Tax=Riemerella columbina TaxID=103810 RepID=UPI0004762B1E|nr:hypothetical protein [Riemerella columbina]